MSLELVPPTLHLEHGGFKGEVRGHPHQGTLSIGKYRGVSVTSARSLAEIRHAIDRLDEDAFAKAARAKALKEAAENPVPALFADRQLPSIGVRGIDLRSGYALVTVGDRREQVSQARVLRMLTDEERKQWEQAHVEHDRAEQAVPSATTMSDLIDDEREEYSLNGVVVFDPDRDAYIFEHNGKLYETNGWQPVRFISDEIYADAVVARFPFAYDGQEVCPSASIRRATYTYLFATKAEANTFAQAVAALSAAKDQISHLQKEFAFDFSAFQTQH